MSQYGWKGASFPFRLSNKGGLALSVADYQTSQHIEESIEQILNTRKGERPMKPDFGCNIDYSLFSPNDIAIQNLLRYEICKALTEQEPRITVNEKDITFKSDSSGSILSVYLTYTVNDYNKNYEVDVKLR